jgi:hypothetical protein
VSVYGSEGMVKRHNIKVRKIKGLLRLVRKRVPFLHENPFLKNFSDFCDTLLVGTSIVGWFSTFMKKLWFLGFLFLFQKIRMVPVLILGPEKMGALSPVLIQFLKIYIYIYIKSVPIMEIRPDSSCSSG